MDLVLLKTALVANPIITILLAIVLWWAFGRLLSELAYRSGTKSQSESDDRAVAAIFGYVLTTVVMIAGVSLLFRLA